MLAMAGGVALNCVMNARLRDSGIFDALWVQPAGGRCGHRARRRAVGRMAASDGAAASGTAGAARWQHGRTPTSAPASTTRHRARACAGPSCPTARLADVAETAVAELLADNRIVGWFQGRMEFGPRALGARSILASPIDPSMQARLNELKDREDFRPGGTGGPAGGPGRLVPPADANGGVSPFMLFVYDVAARPVGAHSVGMPHRPHRPRADGGPRHAPALPRVAARHSARAPACRCS